MRGDGGRFTTALPSYGRHRPASSCEITRETCIGLQRLSFPLAVRTPRSSSARAMPPRLVMPRARSSVMRRSQPLRVRSRRRLARPASRLLMLRPELRRALRDRAVLAQRARFTLAADLDTRAFTAASAAFVRSEIISRSAWAPDRHKAE